MNLRNKKELAARTLNIGKERIVFLESRKNEIKEAITKQDIRDLMASGAIAIKEPKGQRKIKKKKGRKGPGSIRKKINQKKKDYIIITRKLRNYIKELKKEGGIDKNLLKELRKIIKNRAFKSKEALKKYLGELNK